MRPHFLHSLHARPAVGSGNEGAAALLAVLLLMAATLVIVTGLSLRGIGQLQSADVSRRGSMGFAGTEACIAEALRQLRDQDAYAGGTLSVGATTCTVTVTDDGGGQRTIRSTGTNGAVVRHVRAVVTVGSTVISGRTIRTLTLISWQEDL